MDSNIFDLKQPTRSEILAINSMGNFKTNNIILRGLSTKYAILTEDLSVDVIFNNLIVDLQIKGLNDWLDAEHLGLKQMTGTNNIFKSFKHMPVMLQLQLSEFFNTSKMHVKMIKLRSIIEKRFVDGPMSFDVWRTAFKKFSISVKKSSDFFDDYWLYTDLELLVGYPLSNTISDDFKLKSIEEWSKNEVSRGIDENNFYDETLKVYNDRLDSFKHNNFKFLSVNEFLLKINLWMTDGSSRGTRINFMFENKVMKSNAKKQAIPMKYNNNELLKLFLGEVKSWETYSASLKIEPGRKGRLIISAPMSQQLRMAYVEYCLGNLFKLMFPEINYLKNSRNQLKNANKMTIETRINRKSNNLFFPADATAFDHNVSRKEIDIFMDIMILFITKQCDKNLLHGDVLVAMSLIKDLFFDIPILLNAKKVGYWQHGLPSGIKWTALLGSIINIVRYVVIKNLSKNSVFGPLNEKFITVQGDDMAIIYHKNLDALRLLHYYEYFNIPIHFHKNYISYTSIEFLRKVHFGGKQLAYPARLVTKLLFRLPENTGSKDNQSLLQERLGSIFKLYTRHGNSINSYPRLINLISYVLSVNMNKAEIYLHLPNALGGFGFIKPNERDSLKSHFTTAFLAWSKVERDLGNVEISGSYIESLNYSDSKLGFKTPIVNLKKGLTEALSSVPVRYVQKIVKESEIKINTKVNINHKIHISIDTNINWGTWVLSSNLSFINLADILSSLRSRNDRQTLLMLTDDSILELFNIMMMKADDNMFWDWVEGKLLNLSFTFEGFNDVSRSILCDQVLSSFIYRWLRTHKNLSLKDYNTILFTAWKYLEINIRNIVNKNYMLYTVD